MSFTVGAWIIPLFVTLAAFALAFLKLPEGGRDYDFVSPLLGCGLMLIATIVSLTAWLVWALL